jgi:hypothetical protein
MASALNLRHIVVTILAECPGFEPVHIEGFKSKTEIDEWINSDHRIAWLRSQGYAK